MRRGRFHLPPLDLVRSFEAAARSLSFTKAAEELCLTQSAVSQQMRALEKHLDIPLFERRHRALALTEHGLALYDVAVDLLERLQEATDRLRKDGLRRRLTVTTTSGFAALWLIPRLPEFVARHPDGDVRIWTTYTVANLERDLSDVAVRYCPQDEAPGNAVRLFGEELFPVCSPNLLKVQPRPLRNLHDLKNCVLLHMVEAFGFLDWGTWLAAHGIFDLRAAASLSFNNYEQLVGATLSGQGVAMGIGQLVGQHMERGQLVAPFAKRLIGSRGYFIVPSALTGSRPHVRTFVDWLTAEAKAAAIV